MVLLWPLLLISAGVVAGSWLERAQPGPASTRPSFRGCASRLRLIRAPAVLCGSVLLLWEALAHVGKHDLKLSRARLDAQAWIAHRPNVTGVLTDWNLFTGGYLWLGRTLPLMNYQRELLDNPLFTHVLVAKNHGFVRVAKKYGFVPVWDHDSVSVFERRSSAKTGNQAGQKRSGAAASGAAP